MFCSHITSSLRREGGGEGGVLVNAYAGIWGRVRREMI